MSVTSSTDLRSITVILLDIILLVGSQVQVPELCTTPFGSIGTCIVLTECSALDRLLRKGDPASVQEVLRKSHCGFQQSMPKVCCSNEMDKPSITFPGKDSVASSRPIETSTYHTTVFTSSDQPERPSTMPPITSTSTSTLTQHTVSLEVTNRINETIVIPGLEWMSVPPAASSASEKRPEIHSMPTNPAADAETELPGSTTQRETAMLPDKDHCGSVVNNNKIVGGENTGIDEFPWMALLKYRVGTKDTFGCGGVVISKRYVMTAAHCIRTPNNYKLKQVRLGEWNLETPVDCEGTLCNDLPVNVDIEEVLVHPDFDSRNLTNDIALIRLAAPLNFTDWIQPICLPDSRDQDFSADVFWVAGWGQTEVGKISPIKKKVEVGNVELSICSVSYRRLKIMLGPGNLCAGGRYGQDTCRGDSGGGLMKIIDANYYAVGVVSLGPTKCGLEGWPGVYTKVSHYVNWIKTSLRP